MPRLQSVTMDELKKLDDTATSLLMDLHDVNRRIEQGYCSKLEKPAELTRTFLSVTRATAELSSLLMTKAAMQEMQRETEELIRKQAEKSSG